MLDVQAHTDASSAGLWAVVSDLTAWPQHLPTVDALTPLQTTEPAVGARYRVRQPGLPPATWRITEWEPLRGFTWVSRTVGLTTTATHHIVADEDGCALRLTLDWRGPLAWLVRRRWAGLGTDYLTTEATTFAAMAARP